MKLKRFGDSVIELGERMKNKITQRLVIINLFILTMSLFCFFLITVYSLNTQAMQQAEQLIVSESIIVIERTVNTEKIFHDATEINIENSMLPSLENQSDSYFSLSQNEESSIHIFCGYDEEQELLLFPELDGVIISGLVFDDTAIEEISNVVINEPTTITLNDEKYLVLVAPYETGYQSVFVVSFLALEGILTLQISNVMQFGIVFIGLLIAAFILILWQSIKITAPLKALTTRSGEYANHDFSKPFVIHTGDEIESLSHSIEVMVKNIVSHEQSQLTLFRNLSHELKTPLTAISGYAQNIENGYYEDESIPLTIIQDECKRIHDMLDNLIFLNKINSNVERFVFEPTNLVTIVTNSIEKIESIAILNEIDIIYSPPQDIIVSGDYDKLVRVCINVLSNALKFTKDYVRIELINENDVVSIIISDNGEGFAKNKLEKLFFTPTGESIYGNGIGLQIVYEVIKQHGGKVSARNKLEGGAEVIIQIPRINEKIAEVKAEK